jgi:hypothetical protein
MINRNIRKNIHYTCNPPPLSKLQLEIYKLVANGLDLQIHCVVYRMDSQRGSTDLPRYWFQLGKEIIWDYPKDFIGGRQPDLIDIYTGERLLLQ